jgi:hypothetical protein
MKLLLDSKKLEERKNSMVTRNFKTGLWKCFDCKIVTSNISSGRFLNTPLCIDCYLIRIGVVKSMSNTNQSSLLDFEGGIING